MSCELLIFAREKLGDLDPDKNVRKGEIVHVAPDGWVWGGKETLPDFVQVVVKDGNPSDLEAYKEQWIRRFNFENIKHKDPSTMRLKLFVENVRSSDARGAIKRSDVERYVDEWYGKFVSKGNNAVTIDLNIYDALTSPGFFDIDVGKVVFTEVDHDDESPEWTIDMDYSAVAADPERVEYRLKKKGAEILSHRDSVVRYKMDREDLKNRFLDVVKDHNDAMVGRSVYRLKSDVVDDIVAEGGRSEMKLSEVTNNLIDVRME